MKETFIQKDFRGSSLEIIDQANEIIEEYSAEGYTLTLRQLYYQFVARDLVRNDQKEYKRIGSIINDARLAGLIDWDAMEDRTRNLKALNHWSSPRSIVRACSYQFRYGPWEEQPVYIEVWIEKEALIGVIEPICKRLDVPFFACRGYTSQSEQYRAGKRLLRHADAGRDPIIFHLGDHDPSGIDMTRDNQDRLRMFSAYPVEVERLALNMDQVREHNPPPNPAKMTDSRHARYVSRYGYDSWELDALDPRTISRIIEEAVRERIDQAAWDSVQERTRQARKAIEDVADYWDEAVEYVQRTVMG